MIPTYDLNKIKFATNGATFKRAVGLYESGKVTEVRGLDSRCAWDEAVPGFCIRT